MGLPRINSFRKVMAQLLLLVLPTFVLCCYLLFRLNDFYSVLENAWLKQGMYLLSGLALSVVFYAYRFRFLTTAALVILINILLYRFLGNLNVGEFDAFFFSVQFLIFSLLFSAGWIAGYAFARSRSLTIAWSVLLLVLFVVLVSKSRGFTFASLIGAFLPALGYTFYIIYTAELIRNLNEQETKFSWFILKRMTGFALACLVFFLLLFSLFRSDFKAVEQEWGEGKSNSEQKGNSESMTQEDKDGGISNKDQTRLTGSLSKDKQLVFVARLDNFFEEGRVANPLYFTSHYYTLFDTATQTFETDGKMPYNDLFSPDPSQIPLYFAATDSSKIKNSLASLNRKVVTAEVYKVAMSPRAFVAPSTAFYCQPISVPKEYREQYKSAYRARMWVSELNSAYFIYNPAGNYMLQSFQEWRFEKLRKIRSIRGPDKTFMDYYTYMPSDQEYRKIRELALEVTKDAVTPIDKIIAIRDYFLSKDEMGQPLFAYSDNPGIPGMPSANKLTYFLLENRKGYCAYFAGATLFMLRAIGIPSRVAAGYLAEDRSNKNPGWYWFYQDQAHAWVQVYFQDYGWIDFDTTVPDVNTQQASQPDGTPPEEVPEIYLVAEGKLESVDTLKKRAVMRSRKLILHEKEFSSSKQFTLDLDASIASVTSDTGEVRFSVLRPGMRVTAVSHAEALKNIRPALIDSLENVIGKLPRPVPVDELRILMEESKTAENRKKDAAKKGVSLLKIIRLSAIVLLALLLLLFLSPVLLWTVMNRKARTSHSPFSRHRAALFYLTQLGYSARGKSPAEYAEEIDGRFGTDYSRFTRLYQKWKYSSAGLSDSEREFILSFYPAFIRTVRRRHPLKQRIAAFLNFYHTLHFFSKPNSEYGRTTTAN